VGAFAAAGARVARAQLLEPPRSRQGYYFALGYQLAVSHPTEDGESWGVWPGGNLSIRFGQLITRRFGMGLQINSGSTRGQGQNAAAGGLELEAQWELARNLAAFGGVGVDVVSLTTVNGQDKKSRGTVGSGYSLGLGYDWFFGHRLTGGWAATPTLQARFVPGNTASAVMGLIGVQLSYWTGLPRNQLDLPPGEAFQRQ
jgi:Ca2+-binding RTX toxin-like protein